MGLHSLCALQAKESGISDQSMFTLTCMNEKRLYIIAGCNGAGKTTASFTILPEMLDCKEFVNADEIARGLSPFNPESVAMQAGKIMLTRINELLGLGTTFAFETTLSSKTYKARIIDAKRKGFRTTLLFFWLESIALAKERVNIRVKEGGHDIPPDIIERRYIRGVKNLFDVYLPITDGVLIFDNSAGQPLLVAEKHQDGTLIIIHQERYNSLKHFYDNY